MSGSHGCVSLASEVAPSVETTETSPLALLDDIVRYAFARLGSIEDAEDVAMEVFETVHRMERRLARKKNPRLYVFGIARRKTFDKFRERVRAQKHRVPETQEQDSSEASLRRHMIGQALDSLPDLQRDVLVLKYLHGFSVREISEMVSKSEEAVNSLLQRARAGFAEHAADLVS